MASLKFYLNVWLAITVLIFEVTEILSRLQTPIIFDVIGEVEIADQFPVNDVLNGDEPDNDDRENSEDIELNLEAMSLNSFLAFMRDSETGDTFCGGVILDSINILTAASCLQNENISQVIVTLDGNEPLANTLGYSVLRVTTSRIFREPNETSESESDIAVLTLQEPLLEGTFTQAVIGNNDDISNRYLIGLRVYVKVLMLENEVKVDNYYMKFEWSEVCSKDNPLYTDDLICATPIDHHSLDHSSQILDGGPIIIFRNGIQAVVGIALDSTIFGPSDELSFFTDVVSYTEFLKQRTQNIVFNNN